MLQPEVLYYRSGLGRVSRGERVRGWSSPISRGPTLTDEMGAWIEPLLPSVKGLIGPPFRPHRPVVEGVLYRLRTGVPWQDLPGQYGAWQTVHRRHQK